MDVSAVHHNSTLLRYSVSLLGYGFYGDIIKDSEKKRWMGLIRYDFSGSSAPALPCTPSPSPRSPWGAGPRVPRYRAKGRSTDSRPDEPVRAGSFRACCSTSFRRLNESKVKGAQSCPALCDPVNCTVHGILQARILELVAFPFFRGSSQPRDQTQVFCVAGGFFTS